MYPNQQQQPLPYPVDRPISNMVNVDFNRPPFVPENIQCIQWLHPFIPLLSACLIDRTQAQAGRGPISMFFFNQMSANGWRNGDFHSMVADAADFIFLDYQHNIPHPQDIATRIVPQLAEKFIDLRSMFVTAYFPALWQYIDPRDQPNIQAMQNTFSQIMSRITMMRQDTAQTYQGQPVNRGGQPPQPYSTNSSVYSGGYQQPQAAAQPSRGGRDYVIPASAATSMAPPFAPSQPTAAQASAAPVVVEENVDPSKAIWRGPKELPYPPAYNPMKVTLKYKLDGKLTHPILETADMIDYDRHNIATLFGKPPAGTKVLSDNATSDQRLVNVINDDIVDASVTEKNLDTDHVTLTETVCEISLEAALLLGRANQLAYAELPRVLHVNTEVYKPIIGGIDMGDEIRNFAKSSSYIELREKIRAAGETCGMAIAYEANRIMTDHVNHMLAKRLSIEPKDLLMTSFIDDLDALFSIFKNNPNYGERVEKAFLLDQKREIFSLFNSVDLSTKTGADLSEVLTSNLLGTAWIDRDDKPTVNFIGCAYLLTYLDVDSHDLQVAGIPKIGNGLVMEFQPVLYSLAKQLFKNQSANPRLARQLVITRDERILELTLGNLVTVEDFYLVSIVR